MQHETTAYDQMVVPRINGKRRHTRRLLTEKCWQLLEAYRIGRPVVEADCPLRRLRHGLTLDLPVPRGDNGRHPHHEDGGGDFKQRRYS